MEWGSSGHIAHLIATYGFLAIGVIIALESMGLPLPGESVLVLAALYAAHHGHSITAVVASAAVGAMLGDNVGYWIGREFGYRLLRRYGSRIGLSSNKIKLGQYLFLRHGSAVVFFGRFVAVLRVLAAVLAGVNRMDWRRFVLANAAGAILWASAVGFGSYFFGRAVMHVTRPAVSRLQRSPWWSSSQRCFSCARTRRSWRRRRSAHCPVRCSRRLRRTSAGRTYEMTGCSPRRR